MATCLVPPRTTPILAAMNTEKLAYHHGSLELEAHVARPAGGAPAPVVLVCHAWRGQSDFERSRAEQLAALGYVGVALDVYGKGVLGRDAAECTRLMTPFMEDRALLRARLLAGLAAARGLSGVDASRVAAIGFCFGGLCALDLARTGEALRGVVSFHGLLKPNGLAPERIGARVLVLHGYDDPMATPPEVNALCGEMTAAGADYQVHMYGGTVHAFTNPAANDTANGMVYSARAERRSRESMTAFLREVFEG